ncbi:hypothetical protein chiPu_0010022 [Chiloscyllium punctatum]|uniref:Uncharacterized protein n=1 Tax=Chiloscyllium punctatum TaxID=137246 RepID=A0A401SMG2_CHIPU|nr:hypothetical protein [Chiloscyllium punctatum]
MPSKLTAKPDIVDNKDGIVTVSFALTENGLHEMVIKCDGNQIPGSPLLFYVDVVISGHVKAYTPGFIHGVVNKPVLFTVDTKHAGEGTGNEQSLLFTQLLPDDSGCPFRLLALTTYVYVVELNYFRVVSGV